MAENLKVALNKTGYFFKYIWQLTHHISNFLVNFNLMDVFHNKKNPQQHSIKMEEKLERICNLEKTHLG